MAVFTRLGLDQACTAAARWGIGNVRELHGIAAGSVNSNFRLEADRGTFFLRLYEERDRAGAERDAALLVTIAARVPTPAPIATTDGARVVELAGRPAALMPWVEGGVRCQASVRERDADAVGGALARMHLACADVDAGEGRFDVPDVRRRLEAIARDPAYTAEAAHLGARLDAWSARRDPSLPRGFVHGDLFRDNVLWDEAGAIAALLDFESASTGPLVYDLMVTVLAWCFGDGLDLRLAGAMVRGYGAVRPLEPRERASLAVEGCLAAIRFTATRITDYAQRGPSEGRVMKDWRRFRQRLDALEALGDEGVAALA